MEKTFVIGITFKNADVAIRSAFSLCAEKQKACYEMAREMGFSNFIVMSTCNRTEIYGMGLIDKAEEIILAVSKQDADTFNTYKFTKTEEEALSHIFKVASGLDSQILGDYQILGQFKNACKLSKEEGLLGPVFERMSNICIQSSKEIKTKTEISKGTVSSSYAAIEILKERFGDEPTKCLLIGTGKFGSNIAKNIKHYLPKFDLSISNRTYFTAYEIGKTLELEVLLYEEIQEKLREFEVVILCSNSDNYIVNVDDLRESSCRLIMDLSVPQTVHPDCKRIEGVEVMDIDSISKMLDKSLEHRKKFLPLANEIIHAHISNFIDWNMFYQKRAEIVNLKNMLIEKSKSCPHFAAMEDSVRIEMVNKAIQTYVLGMKGNQVVQFEAKKVETAFLNMAVGRY